jgi:hypothetical protein
VTDVSREEEVDREEEDCGPQARGQEDGGA